MPSGASIMRVLSSSFHHLVTVFLFRYLCFTVTGLSYSPSHAIPAESPSEAASVQPVALGAVAFGESFASLPSASGALVLTECIPVWSVWAIAVAAFKSGSVAVALSASATCVVMYQGSVSCFGSNFHGQVLRSKIAAVDIRSSCDNIRRWATEHLTIPHQVITETDTFQLR